MDLPPLGDKERYVLPGRTRHLGDGLLEFGSGHEPVPEELTPRKGLRCSNCGRKPASKIDYSGITGFGAWHLSWRFKQRLCRECSHGAFRETQAKLLTVGWAGIESFFWTPILVIANSLKYLEHRGGVKPPQPADGDLDAALKGKPVFSRPGPQIFAVILALIIASVVFATS